MKRNCYKTERGLAAHSDEYLLAAAKDGEHPAFIELSRRSTPMVLRVLVRITKNEDDAEDMMQETLMKAFTHLKRFEGRSSFSTWLTRIAVNTALMALRKRRRHLEVPFDGDLESEDRLSRQYIDLAPNPEYVYLQDERQRRLREAIQRLPAALRECIEIQHKKDGSVQEIANIVGISLSATKSRLLRARKEVVTSFNRKNLIKSVRRDGETVTKEAWVR
jgi:RNA polymerase sigma factor (sigma-70 family)